MKYYCGILSGTYTGHRVTSFKQSGDWRYAKILSVDDEPLVIRTVAAILKTGRFTCVEGIANPLETMQKIQDFQPDLVLLDINMPEQNGLDLLEEIKSESELSQIVVIMLTAEGSDLKWRSLELGAADYINKPIEPRELIMRVRHALKSNRPTTPD